MRKITANILRSIADRLSPAHEKVTTFGDPINTLTKEVKRFTASYSREDSNSLVSAQQYHKAMDDLMTLAKSEVSVSVMKHRPNHSHVTLSLNVLEKS